MGRGEIGRCCCCGCLEVGDDGATAEIGPVEEDDDFWVFLEVISINKEDDCESFSNYNEKESVKS